jgi:hypothetical protein
MRFVGIVALTVVLATRGAAAQSAADHFAAGVHAYDELQFGPAADHLRRSVTSADSGLTGPVRSQALAYLGAAEWFQGRPDSAAAAFRRLVFLDPGFHLDTLRFPPAITTVFETLRRQTYTVRADAAPTTEIRVGESRPLAVLTSSAPHRVRVTLVRDSGAAQKLLDGLVRDTATVTWDGRAGSQMAGGGAYDLAVTSFDATGRPVHESHLGVTVWTQRPDTLPYPDFPAPTMPDPPPLAKAPSRGAALAWGLVTAGAALLLPRALNGTGPTAYSGVAAGLIGAVSIGGAVRPTPKPVPLVPVVSRGDNRRWSDSVSVIRAENARRLAHDVVLHVQVTPKSGDDP